MTETQPYRQRLETRMIDIAERLIASEGLGAVQARRIALEADCSVGTLYNVFAGLDGLIVAANMRTLKALGTTLEVAMRGAQHGSLQGQLLALAMTYRDFAVRESRRWRALFDHRMEADQSVPDSYRAEQAELFRLVEACLLPHIASATERATAARALFSAVHGIVWLALDNKLDSPGPEEAERQVRFIVSAAARGLEAARGQAA